MSELKQTRGGARKGAGRKPKLEQDKVQRTQVTLSPALMMKFKELGGSRWLAKMIENNQNLDKKKSIKAIQKANHLGT